MRRLNPLIAILAALIIPIGYLIAAAPAMAFNVSQIYRDCEDNGSLSGHYSRAELQAALNDLPSEAAEYSDCQDLIQQALLHVSSSPGGHHTGSHSTLGSGGKNKGGGGNGKGSARGHSAKAQTALGNKARPAGTGSDSAGTLAGSGIRPGSTGSGSSSLPVALVIVLILLALTAVSGGAVAIRRRVDARQGT